MVPGAGHTENGGHFFIASHGIRIQQAANSLIIWKPTLWHATSLPLQHPRKPDTVFSQSGLAFVTSPRLPKAWKRYRDKKLSKEDAERLLLVHDDSGSTDSNPPLSQPNPDLGLTQPSISVLGDLVSPLLSLHLIY